MTTTTRRKTPAKKAKPPTGDVREETLLQFDRECDEHAGHHVGFADMVRQLFIIRHQIAQLKASRSLVLDDVKAAYDAGHRAVAGYTIRHSEPGEAVAYRAVESATVKKADAAAWKRAHAPAPFVQVKGPAKDVQRVPLIDAPGGGGYLSPEQAVVLYREHPAWAKLRALQADEADLKERFDKLAADFGWDGGATDGPLVFSDGWSIQLCRNQFSGEKLREIDPALWDTLAVSKTKAAPARIVVAKADGSDGEFDAEAE